MPQPFNNTLAQLRAGRTHDELGDHLAALVSAVMDTGKKGSLSLTLTVRPPKGRDSAYVTIDDAVTLKMPASDRGDTVFFPVAGGGLSRQDPTQLEMKLRGVPAFPAVDVDTSTGEITSTRSA